MTDPDGPRRRSALLHTRIRAETARLRRAGVHPHRALELAVYACRDGMAPHERAARAARRAYDGRDRPDRFDSYG